MCRRALRHAFDEYDDKFFLREVRPGSEEAEWANSVYDETVLRLAALVVDFKEQSKKRVSEDLALPAIPDRRNIQSTVVYAIDLHRRLSLRLQEFTQNYFGDAISIIRKMLTTLQEKRDGGVPLHCSSEEVDDYFRRTFATHKFPKRVRFRLDCLKQFVARFIHSPPFPTIPPDHLRAAMRESAPKVIEAIEFSPHGFFDDFLEFFIRSHPTVTLKEFDKLAAKMASQANTTSVDFSEISSLVRGIVKSLKPKTQADVIVIKNGVCRIFFDRFYLVCPDFLASREAANTLAHTCQFIWYLTPRDLSVPDSLMKPDMMDVPLMTLVQKTPALRKAQNEIEFLPFLRNPIDVMAHVFIALKAVEDFARQNCLENKFGQFIGMIDQNKVASRTDRMAFDELFPMFCSVFAFAWPVNAVQLAAGLDKAKGLVTASAAFDFAKSFFTSAVEYIGSLKTEDFMKAALDDDGDPLGLTKA